MQLNFKKSVVSNCRMLVNTVSEEFYKINMKESYNKLVISRISTFIPSHIKTVDFLMDALDIGRESAYRRIRDQVPFTLEEVARLSSLLNFSVDEIIGANNSNGSVLVKSFIDPEQTCDGILYQMMEDYYSFLMKGGEYNDLEVIVASNRLPIFYFSNHPHLLKFFYYKCCRRNNDIALNTKFSEINLPEKIAVTARKIVEIPLSIKKEIFIFDEYIYLSSLKEIQHYYFQKLITDSELQLLKEDFRNFLKYVESLSQSGRENCQTETLFYLSSINMENNQMLLKYGNNMIFIFFISFFRPIYVTELNPCLVQKKWLDSLKKQSVLITDSNEINQSAFFIRQYEYLEKLGNQTI